MLVSAVIVNYNQREHTVRCVASALVALAAVDGRTEVVVVDNASADGTAAAIRERFPEVAVVENVRNAGFAGGAAEGMRRTTGRWILMLNNDATVDPGAVRAMLAAGEADPVVGSVAAKIVFADGSDRINSAGFEVDRLGVAVERALGQPAGTVDGEPQAVFGASAGGALLRRTMVEETGGFDESFFLFLEDVDLAWRARLRGWRCVLVPQAVVHHHHSVSAGHGSDLKYFHVGRNRVRLLARNAPTRHLLRYGPAIVAYDLAYVAFAAVTDRTAAPLTGRLRGLREWRRYRTTGASRGAAMLVPARGLGSARRRRAAWLSSSAGVPGTPSTPPKP